MTFRAEAIIPESALANPEALTGAVAKALDVAAQEIKAEFDSTHETWNTPVEFQIESPAQFSRNIYTRNLVYSWVNDGTPPHEILPVRARALAFMTGGASKTTPGSLAAGPGAPGGETIVRRSVHHPGVAARQFDLLIANTWQDGKFQQRLQAALNEL